MDDLVQRLRSREDASNGFYLGPLADEAADKIERMRSHILAGLQREAAFAEQAEKQDAEIERLRAQLAARDRDVERYRWLRARKPGGKYRIAGLIYSDGDEHFDAAIDAAMAPKP